MYTKKTKRWTLLLYAVNNIRAAPPFFTPERSAPRDPIPVGRTASPSPLLPLPEKVDATATAAAMTTPVHPFRPSYLTCFEISELCPAKATTMGYIPNQGINTLHDPGLWRGRAGHHLLWRVEADVGVLDRRCGGVRAGMCRYEPLFHGREKQEEKREVILTHICALIRLRRPRAALLQRVELQRLPDQIVAIILGPTLVCIGLYLTLRHMVLAIDPKLSRIPPRAYPLIFVPADVSCLVVQAIGGGLQPPAARTTSSSRTATAPSSRASCCRSSSWASSAS